MIGQFCVQVSRLALTQWPEEEQNPKKILTIIVMAATLHQMGGVEGDTG